MKVKKLYYFYLFLFLIIGVWSGIQPFDTGLWFLEAGICIIGVTILLFTFKRFEFTTLTYTFILIHLIILFIGAHYSYAEEPLFEYLQEVFHWERNNYDKVGHFMQGFVPAMISRELLIRQKAIRKESWIPFLIICISLSISAFYELIEWWVASISHDGATDFLGMQGYEWDTQSDMLFALLGAICMLLFFSRIQNHRIEKMG